MLCDEVIILAAIGIRSTAGMEAYFPRKALAMLEASLPQEVFLVVLNHLRSV